ncbi:MULTISPECIES: hypothetical protein [Pseudomonas]|uniref:hypothetical protein n=1 Tax=Pseudomonas TaxID=286 RepID=UPI000720EB38|nr:MULTISPECIES: hypothetical protein [Pseudomonas]ALQ02594.1 hypothetical protein AK973_2145 [Pseudomonas brassicacearum]
MSKVFDQWRRNSPYNDDRVLAIGGGSEEILLELAGRWMGFGAGFGIEDARVRASR